MSNDCALVCVWFRRVGHAVMIWTALLPSSVFLEDVTVHSERIPACLFSIRSCCCAYFCCHCSLFCGSFCHLLRFFGLFSVPKLDGGLFHRSSIGTKHRFLFSFLINITTVGVTPGLTHLLIYFIFIFSLYMQTMTFPLALTMFIHHEERIDAYF